MSKTYSDDSLSRRESSAGAAASLRERLRQIRDKHKQDDGQDQDEVLPDPPSEPTARQSGNGGSCPLYEDITKKVEILLGEPTPLLEINDIFTNGLIRLRQLHSSLSNSNSDSTGTNPALLKDLRQHIHKNVPHCVKILTRYVNFSVSLDIKLCSIMTPMPIFIEC